MSTEVKQWPQWPYYVVFKDEKDFFKIGGRSKYMWVDLPNYIYEIAASTLYKISNKASTFEEAYNLAKEEIKKLNEDFKKAEFDFVSFQIRKSMFGKKPKINLIINVNPSKFEQYLEKLSSSKITLNKKYSFITSSRLYLITLFMRSPELVSEFMNSQKVIKVFVQRDLEAALSILGELKVRLSNIQNLAEIKYRKRFIPFFYYFLPETIANISSCILLIKNGLATAVYREFRRILEIVSYSVFLDNLLRNTISMLKKADYDLLEDYTNHIFGYSERHYKILMDIKEKDAKGSVANLREFEDKLKPIVEDILTYTKLCGKSVSKRRVFKTIREQVSFPLFYYAFGVPIEYINEDNKELFQYLAIDAEKLYELSLRNLIKILISIQNKTAPSQKDVRLSELILDKIRGKSCEIVAPALHPAFLYQYSGKLLGANITGPYRDYSTFIHLYPNTTQILPFSSILEYKVLRNEVEKFSSLLNEIISKYSSKIFLL